MCGLGRGHFHAECFLKRLVFYAGTFLCACGCDIGIVCLPVNLFVWHEKSFCDTHDDCGGLSARQEELEVRLSTQEGLPQVTGQQNSLKG